MIGYLLLSGIEFVRFRGTTCEKKYQYGNFKTLHEAKSACISDQNCIAFHAIQPFCKQWREQHSHLGVPISRKDDYKLCKRNASLTNSFALMWEYNNPFYGIQDIRLTKSNKPTKDCFHDAFVKTNEPGTILLLLSGNFIIVI